MEGWCSLVKILGKKCNFLPEWLSPSMPIQTATFLLPIQKAIILRQDSREIIRLTVWDAYLCNAFKRAWWERKIQFWRLSSEFPRASISPSRIGDRKLWQRDWTLILHYGLCVSCPNLFADLCIVNEISIGKNLYVTVSRCSVFYFWVNTCSRGFASIYGSVPKARRLQQVRSIVH